MMEINAGSGIKGSGVKFSLHSASMLSLNIQQEAKTQ